MVDWIPELLLADFVACLIPEVREVGLYWFPSEVDFVAGQVSEVRKFSHFVVWVGVGVVLV